MGPGDARDLCPESPCLPSGTASPSGLVSGFCAAIKFTAKIKKRKTDANLIFPWGSFISVTSFVMGFCCVCRIKMNRRSRDDMNVFPHCDGPAQEICRGVFSCAAQSPGSWLSVAGVYAWQLDAAQKPDGIPECGNGTANAEIMWRRQPLQ